MRKWILSFTLALPLLAQSASVRELYALSDYEAATRAFAALPSPTVEERAFAVAAFAASGRRTAAEQHLRILQARAPQDLWTLYAATAFANVQHDAQAAIDAGERMLVAAGPAPDDEVIRAHYYALVGAEQIDKAAALLEKAPNTPKVRALRAHLHAVRGEEKEAAAVYEALRKDLPDYLGGWLSPGREALGMRRYAEALPLLKHALTLTTAPRVYGDYWRAVAASQDLTAEQKKAEIDRLIAEVRQRRGDIPEVWSMIAGEYTRAGDDAAAAEWNERVLREAPNTVYAARALWNRQTAFVKKHKSKVREDKALRDERRKLVREYLDYKTDEEDYTRIGAYAALYDIAKSDPESSEAELLEAVQGMRRTFESNPGVGSDAAVQLANRGIRLDLAEELARNAFDDFKKMMSMPGEQATERDLVEKMQATIHDGLGWVLLARGNMDAARNQLLAAYELYPDSATINFHLGRWHEARKELDKAEQRYRRGASLQASDVNLNDEALRKLYEKRHGTLAGYDAYRRNTEKADVVARRAKILSERKKKPAAAPPFQLKTLDGKDVSLASLKGKAAVVNFWGIWCGWCVKEMPEYQQLAKKYANDPNVAILTVNNDGDAAGVRKWMAEQKYDFAVLLDDGFVKKNQLNIFPMTWFLDPQGRIAFEKKGWTRKLLEEFSWRVEELRAR